MKVELTATAGKWYLKWSTWLAALALALDGAAAAFMAGPPEWKAGFPPALGLWLLMAGMGVKALIPVATSVAQKSLKANA